MRPAFQQGRDSAASRDTSNNTHRISFWSACNNTEMKTEVKVSLRGRHKPDVCFKEGVLTCVSALWMFLTAGWNQGKALPQLSSCKPTGMEIPLSIWWGKRRPVIHLMGGGGGPAQSDSDGLKNKKADGSRTSRTATLPALIAPNHSSSNLCYLI